METTAHVTEDLPHDVPARRGSPRTQAVHTAALRVGRQEYLCKTRDLSSGGVGLTAPGLEATRGDFAEVDILFQGVLRRFRGRVAYVQPQGPGVRLGIQFQN